MSPSLIRRFEREIMLERSKLRVSRDSGGGVQLHRQKIKALKRAIRRMRATAPAPRS